jgi:hypothetical protein
VVLFPLPLTEQTKKKKKLGRFFCFSFLRASQRRILGAFCAWMVPEPVLSV